MGAVIEPASVESTLEASRLLKALGETTELEALFAMLSPEQFQGFLKRLRQRASAAGGGGKDDAT